MPPKAGQLSTKARIYVVVVLYNQLPSTSAAVDALARSLNEGIGEPDRFRVLLFDNSPLAAEDELPFAYYHDASNQGLAAAYNYALARATEDGCQWLLLLDQDTAVTSEYLHEVSKLTVDLGDDRRVGAIVPKLESDKGIKSPTLDFLEWLRRQVQFPRKRALFATRDTAGLQEEQFSAFNSASTLRVEALQNIGGFPVEYWLDFLDVAVFNRMHSAGFRIFVMQSTLQHELSMDTKHFYEKQGGLARHRNLLAAMVRFVQAHGTRRDIWLARAWLLRNALNLFASARDKRFSLASLRQAILLDPTTSRD